MKSLYPLLLSILLPLILPAQSTFNLKGCAKYWATNQPVKNVDMQVAVYYNSLPDPFFFGTPSPDSLCSIVEVTVDLTAPNTGFFISALKSDPITNHRNGLSVADLICINRHILGLEPLPFPGQIAADANNSRSVTTFDIVELRKLLLGIYDSLPAFNGWVVWPGSCPYPNPNNPFVGVCENIPFDSLPAFAARDIPLEVIKVGDVDGDYAFGGNYQPNTTLSPINFYLPAHQLIAGDTVSVPLYFQSGFTGEGLQFALRYDTAALQLLNILPGAGTYIDNWGVFSAAGLLTNVTLNPGLFIQDTLAGLQFVVKSGGLLSKLLTLDNSVLPARYTNGDCGILGKLNLLYSATTAVQTPDLPAFLSPPSPNPFTAQTVLSLRLNEAAEVRLEVLDLTGRSTFFQSGAYMPGNHVLEIPAEAVAAGNMGIYRVQVGDRVFVGKLIRY